MNTNKQRNRAWNVLGTEPTTQSVMLEDEAPQMSAAEIIEILEYLPNFDGKTVLDLGAGIGRFTARFAEKAKLVTAVDFCRGFHERNQENSRPFKNVTCYCSDVLTWNYPSEKFDLVFSNWLMMYMDNSEVSVFLSKIYLCLKPGGIAFFRESCRCPARGEKLSIDDLGSSVKDIISVTKYREPEFYRDSFADAALAAPISEGNIKLYETRFDNKNQFYWLLKKQ